MAQPCFVRDDIWTPSLSRRRIIQEVPSHRAGFGVSRSQSQSEVLSQSEGVRTLSASESRSYAHCRLRVLKFPGGGPDCACKLVAMQPGACQLVSPPAGGSGYL